MIRRIVGEGGEAVAFGACDDGFDGRLRSEGIDIRHVPISKGGLDPIGDVRVLFALLRRFRELRPDVVHSFTIKPSIYATLAAAVSRVPVRVVTITGLGHAFTSAAPLLRAIVSLLYRVALAWADVVFFQNRDDRDLFVSRGLVDESAARLIGGSGIDLDRFRPVALPSQSGKDVRFLMVARLLREKGIREYVAAAGRLKKRFPGLRFQLLGGVDPRNPSSLTAVELGELRASNCVEWVDEVDDVRPHIGDADVIVLPSYREGLPRSLLEGAAMGRALIATDVPGCREVVRNDWNGYLVPAGDADALAQAMQKLILQPRDIAIFGMHARQLIGEKFDERSVVDQTLDVYAELIRRKARHGRQDTHDSAG